MALLPDRYEAITDISFFNNDESAERGGIVCLATAGSGAAMDQAEALVSYKDAPSGFMPLGMLLNDLVNKDLTRTHLNFHKNEVQKGGKVTVLLEGFAVTNMIDADNTPALGQKLYVGVSGLISTVAQSDESGMSTSSIGRVMSTMDENGYAKVYIKMPAQ